MLSIKINSVANRQNGAFAVTCADEQSRQAVEKEAKKNLEIIT